MRLEAHPGARPTVWAGLLLMLVAGSALGAPDKPCTKEPRAKWLQESAIRAKIEALKYKVVDIDVERSCYVIEVRDTAGKELDLIVDPISGRIVAQEEG
jgi:hypothetical protein